jgi:hypothetical protein
LDAVVALGDGRTFRLEPAHRYPDLADAVALGEHTVVFSEADMVPSHGHANGEAGAGTEQHVRASAGGCGADAHRKLLERQRELGRYGTARSIADASSDGGDPNGNVSRDSDGTGAGALDHRYAESRQRRTDADADREDGEDGPAQVVCTGACTCTVSLFADRKFFDGPYGRSDEARTAQTLINYLAVVDSYYYNTDFGGITGVGLVVRNVVIYTSDGGGNPVTGSYVGGDGAVSFLEQFGVSSNRLGLDDCFFGSKSF